ncbi:MAG TPA: helicase, partial [Clostridiales bacterium]|nr:helicase [Clostridiales bacterium]
MLTKSMIRRNSNSASYDRGTTIYYANGVREFRVEETDNNDYIQANVKGSRHNNYDVRATYDIGEDAIDDINCECPAFSSYSGICKHCVAVLLEYIDFKVRTKAIAKHHSARQEALAKLEKMKGFKGINFLQQKKAQTTPEMKQLLSNHIKKKVLPLVQDSVYGKVRLHPILKCDSASIKIEFKIGITHMYVLKDVFEFDLAIENNEDFTYGVKLHFVHTIDAFDIESRPLVQFIRDWVRK